MQADFERLAGRGTRRVGLSLASRHLNGDLFHHREDGSWKSLAGRPVVAHSCHFLRRLPFDAADRTVATPTLYFISALTIFTNSNWCARRKRDLMAIRRWSIVWTWIEQGWNGFVHGWIMKCVWKMFSIQSFTYKNNCIIYIRNIYKKWRNLIKIESFRKWRKILARDFIFYFG